MEKQLHEGHRARLRQSAKQDEELTSFSEFQVLEYFLSFITVSYTHLTLPTN